ncbi:Multidrug resistance-associated protein 4 [Branchiostoma belcheri]|nr:Multidrug resistance-associated protein 4 [Branchiostoma belcheri]
MITFAKTVMFSEAFVWANAIVGKGYRGRLENEDLYPLKDKDTSLVVTNEFRPYWERELKKSTPKKPPSLSKAIIRCYGLRYFLVGFVKLFDDTLTLVKPILIGYIIKYFEPSSGMTLTDAYMYAGILAGLQVFQVIISYYEWPVHLWAFHFETAIMNMANEKCLRLSTGGLSKTSTGQVSNILADDVQAFKKAFDKLHNLWVAPLTIAVIIWYLINFMGLAALAGLAYMFLTIAIEGSLTPLHIRYGTLENARKDARLDVMSQILQSMRIIKLQAWEQPFSDVINRLRKCGLRIYHPCVQVRATRVPRTAYERATYGLRETNFTILTCNCSTDSARSTCVQRTVLASSVLTPHFPVDLLNDHAEHACTIPVYKEDLTGDCQLVSKMTRKAQQKTTRQDPKKRAAEDTRAASDDEVNRRCTHLQRASE